MLKNFNEFVNEMAKFTDPDYVRPYWKDKTGTIKEVTNTDELFELWSQPGFTFAYGQAGGKCSYIEIEDVNKKSVVEFLSDGSKVNVIDKDGIVLETIDLTNPDINPHMKHIIDSGITGILNKAGNKVLNHFSPTDFKLCRVVNSMFTLLDFDKHYSQSKQSEIDAITNYSNDPSKIADYIAKSSNWAYRVNIYALNNSLSDADKERILISPTQKEFIDVLMSRNKKTIGTSKQFRIPYMRNADGDFTIQYTDTLYYIAYEGDKIFTPIDKETYFKIRGYFKGGKPKATKVITNELDEMLSNIADKYQWRAYTANNILGMQFTYKLENGILHSLKFVNEQIDLGELSLSAMASISFEAMRDKERDAVKSQARWEGIWK